ncbi:MAG TPA: peroxidase family protein [Humisphaera sp.]|jgi:hypothetical protein|nr:peroxidase family protein [Humisphaera sp.]
MSSTVESIDGTGNNLAHSTWGSANTDLLRKAVAAYADGISAPGGTSRPSARVISNLIDAEPDGTPTNNRQLSNFIYAWGQFLDHDLDLTNDGTPADAFNIAVPKGDPQFDPAGTGTQVITLNRSQYDPATGTSTSNPRQQTNSITAWIDASMIYGSDAATAASLRTFSGGKLKTSAGDLLPLDSSGQFLAGDVRAEENPELTTLQIVFVREHNRIAAQIARSNPKLTDEQIYQQARRQVIAEVQEITFNEFLPALLGPAAPRPYAGYNANVNPGIANEFSTAAYRFGHSLVGDDIDFLDNNGNTLRDSMSLAEAFFNPTVIEQNGVDPILKYLASDNAEEVDPYVVNSLRNLLFGQPGEGGMDLAALNIQRGRDHGLADYNTTRAAYGLARVTSFAQITSNTKLQAELQQAYGNVNNIDLWVGGLAEDHLPGASLGPTFARIIADQFARVRDGDRFWYQHILSGSQLSAINHVTLARVIEQNTSLTNLQANVFFFRPSIGGRVYVEVNGNGRPDAGEMGIAGRRVQLIDSDGTIIATTTTRRDGSYLFNDLSLGSFTVREQLPPGGPRSAIVSAAIHITSGNGVNNINFAQRPIGIMPQQPPPPPPPPPGGIGGMAPPLNGRVIP